MVKTYLRYEEESSFGGISAEGGVIFDSKGEHILSGFLETIYIWHLRQGVCVSFYFPRLKVQTIDLFSSLLSGFRFYNYQMKKRKR